MSSADNAPSSSCDRHDWFTTTHWSVLLAAREGDSPQALAALEKLCAAYWYPLYVYGRRLGHRVEQAQDLTQEFFARLLEKNYLEAADREKGKFRSFLLTAFKRFLANEWDRTNRQKRGGGRAMISWEEANAEGRYLAEAADTAAPEIAFDRRWALRLLEEVLDRLEREYRAAGKAKVFEELQVLLTGDKCQSPYSEIAARLRISEGTLKVTVHRLRQRYRELLRLEVANTVASPAEIDDEIRHLFAAIST